MGKTARKDLLKEPDEFVSTAGTTLAWIKEHPANAAIIAAVVLGIIVTGIGLYYWKTTREREAMNALLKATDEYEMTMKAAQGYAGTQAQKLAKLRLARMNYDKGDDAKALSFAEAFLDEWNNTDAFHCQALLIAASCHMHARRYDKALQLADSCLASAYGTLKDQALFLKGTILLAQGKKDEARRVLDAVSGSYKNLAKAALASQNGAVSTQ